MNDKEEIYDARISPLMQQIIEICQQENIQMFAVFQFSDCGFCTSVSANGGHPVFHHLQAVFQSRVSDGVNVDKYITWVAEGARKHGHSSIFLKLAGVPLMPPQGAKP